MSDTDVAALKRALAAYRRLSGRAMAEVAALQLQRGWRVAAIFAAMRMQCIALGLKPHEAPPCDLREETIGGMTRLWFVDPDGVDQRRWETAAILRQLQCFDLSRFEPFPQQAIELERARRQAPPPSAA